MTLEMLDDVKKMLAKLAKSKSGAISRDSADLLRSMGVKIPPAIRIVDPEESECIEAHVVVCGDYHGKMYQSDNMLGTCAWCERPIQRRPDKFREGTIFVCGVCGLAKLDPAH